MVVGKTESKSIADAIATMSVEPTVKTTKAKTTRTKTPRKVATK